MESIKHQKIEEKIKKLRSYRNSLFPILSLYLGFEGKKSSPLSLFLSKLHSLIYKNFNKDEQEIFRKDVAKIDSYLRDFFDTRGNKSIVFFSSGKNLWEVISFEFYLPPLCLISNSPYLIPLQKAITEQKKYLVLLVDRKKARLFTVHLGNIEEHIDVFGEFVPQKVRQINKAWAREDKILRHIEDHLHRHLQLIAKITDEFAKNKDFKFLILGGHRGLFKKIKKHLPKYLTKKIKDTFVTELNIPLNDIYLRSKKVIEKTV